MNSGPTSFLPYLQPDLRRQVAKLMKFSRSRFESSSEGLGGFLEKGRWVRKGAGDRRWVSWFRRFEIGIWEIYRIMYLCCFFRHDDCFESDLYVYGYATEDEAVVDRCWLTTANVGSVVQPMVRRYLGRLMSNGYGDEEGCAERRRRMKGRR